MESSFILNVNPLLSLKVKKIDFSINMHKIVYFDYFDLKIESLLVKTFFKKCEKNFGSKILKF